MATTPTDFIISEWRSGRPIVPLLGAGISLGAGFPTIGQLTDYLAKVVFSVDIGLYQSLYPIVVSGLDTATNRYIRRPSHFITDFGWPHLRELNADVWRWLDSYRASTDVAALRFRARELYGTGRLAKPRDIVQAVLRSRLRRTEDELADTLHAGATLRGDWSDLLFHLTEGRLDLVDALFTGLDRHRSPSQAHTSLAFLTQVLGIKLILSVNFDTLLEQAMDSERIPLRIFDVHRDADLPHPSIVQAQNSLLKLHGSAYGLRFGERLNYWLDDNAQHRMNDYLDDNALMVVMGFSGWERRMVQVIDSFARRAARTGKTQVIWMDVTPTSSTGSDILSRVQQDLDTNGYKDALIRMQYCDANTFLPGLLSRLTGSTPSSRRRYQVLTSRPRRPLTRQRYPRMVDDKRLLVFTDLDLAQRSIGAHTPSSWPSFAAAEFVAEKQHSHDIVWVDLENHHTIEGVVKDVLRQIRKVDPQVPQLFLPTEGDESDGPSLRRAASRLRAALSRGSFVVVFDSLDSFCRPQLVHHGMPRALNAPDTAKLNARLRRLNSLLLHMVTDSASAPLSPRLRDTAIILTATTLASRHQGRSKTTDTVNRAVRRLIVALRRASPSASSAIVLSPTSSPRRQLNVRSAQYQQALSRIKSFLVGIKDGVRDGTGFAIRASTFLRDLVRAPGSLAIDDNAAMLFLCFLSTFRRPRPLSLIKSVLARWLAESGTSPDSAPASELNTALDSIIAHMQAAGFVDFLEGDLIWIPREIHEYVYGFISSPLHLSTITLHESVACTISIGLVLCTWHLQIARAYFADAYIPSHDEQAFFEYVYHRVSGLRYLATVQTLVAQASARDLSTLDELVESSAEHVGSARDDEPNDRDVMRRVFSLLGTHGYGHLAAFLQTCGVFSFLRRDSDLKKTLGDTLNRPRGQSPNIRRVLETAIAHLRINGIATLEHALSREHDRISATTTPDTWLGWIEALLGDDMDYISGSWSRLSAVRGCSFPAALNKDANGTGGDPALLKEARSAFASTLIDLQVRMLRSKLDYRQAARAIGKELWGSKIDTDRMVNWVLGREDGRAVRMWRQVRNRFDKHLSIIRQAAFLKCVAAIGRSEHLTDLIRSLVEFVSRKGAGRAHLLLLQFQCEHLLNGFPMWEVCSPTKHMRLHPQQPSGERRSLVDAERISHHLEDLYRQVSNTVADYAAYRSRALSMRARALYLRGHFREGHRLLTQSESDLGDDLASHSLSRAVVHCFRAELLRLSASDHLEDGRGNLAAASRKLDTALGALDLASKWLDPGVQRATWWVRLNLGRAELQHDRILLDISRLFEAIVSDRESYARRSVSLEHSVVDAMRALRVAFDTLPFDSRRWGQIVESPAGEKCSSILSAEVALIRSWLRLLIVSFAAHHVFLTRLQLPQLNSVQVPSLGWRQYAAYVETNVDNLLDNRVVPLRDLLTLEGFWDNKWKPWCEMLQFHHFSFGSSDQHPLLQLLSGKMRARGDSATEWQQPQLTAKYSLRADIIRIEASACEDLELLKVLWNARRTRGAAGARSIRDT